MTSYNKSSTKEIPMRRTFSLLTFFISLSVFAKDFPFGSKPNVILMITDDQGYGPIGKHGNPWIKTPNLDKLHGQSTRFERFLVSPTCSPTRAALMSGRHPMKNGITHTILERERMALSTVTLPQVLAGAGYVSGIFGKWHLGDEEPYQPHKRGFDEAFIHGAGGIGQSFKCSCADVPGNKYFDPTIRHNGSFVKTKGYCTDLFFTAGIGWIKKIKDTRKPFFAYITTNAPHGPFIAPPQNAKRFTDLGFSERDAGFYGMIENIDENMGRLMNKLDQWNLSKDTILIFMSDNGSVGSMVREGSKLGTSEDGKAVRCVYDVYLRVSVHMRDGEAEAFKMGFTLYGILNSANPTVDSRCCVLRTVFLWVRFAVLRLRGCVLALLLLAPTAVGSV